MCSDERERERERERDLWMVSWHLLFYKILDGKVVKYFLKMFF
jgi:hypothetical protein